MLRRRTKVRTNDGAQGNKLVVNEDREQDHCMDTPNCEVAVCGGAGGWAELRNCPDPASSICLIVVVLLINSTDVIFMQRC